jgi:LysR family transcriptional regulator, transcriptional activator for bauABCD operon
MIGQIHDIDLRLLQVFRTVVRCEGLAAARAELNASLPTISLQIKQLEERLGVRLCWRGSTGFRVTPQGEQVLRAAEQLAASFEDFNAQVAGMLQLPIGEVRLGVMANLMTNPSCRIHAGVAKIQEIAPGVQVSFFIGSPSELESQILSGALHVAVGLFTNAHPTLEYSEVFEETHCLYCSSSHPLSKMSEKAFDLAALQSAHYVGWAQFEAYLKSPFALSQKTSSPFLDGIACLILSGQYVGYLPRYFAARWVEQGLLRAVWRAETARVARVLLIRRKANEEDPAVALLSAGLLEAHRTDQKESIEPELPDR